MTDDTVLDSQAVLRDGLTELIESIDRKDCFDYSEQLFDRARSHNESQPALAAAYRVLGDATSLDLIASSREEPFSARRILNTGRTAVIDDFSESDLAFLAELYPLLDDPELVARLADIVWIRDRSIDAAKIGVKAYFASANLFHDLGRWINAASRAERGVRIARFIRSGNEELFRESIEAIQRLLRRSIQEESQRSLPLRYMRVLQEFREGDFAEFSKASQKLAEQMEAAGDYSVAQNYWRSKARWDELAEDHDASHAALVRMAAAKVSLADIELAQQPPNYIGAAELLIEAIERFSQNR